MSRYHVVVVGAGPGGYVAAIRAAQLGYSTAIVEREKLGGICLNWGCIPTKSLLESAHRLEDIRRAADFGLRVNGDVAPDFSAVIQRSRGIADEMSRGVEYLMKKNKLTVISGEARFIDNFKIEVADGDEKSEIEADRFIVATGARSRSLPGVPIDGKKIVGYREAMVQEKLPARLCIVGAGAIGVEFADFYASMGSDVTLLEAMPHVLPLEDEEVAKVLARSFQKREIKIQTGVRVQEATVNGETVTVKYTDAKSEGREAEFDLVLSAAGVAANTDGLGLEELGVRMSRDRVVVNDHYQTSIANIYAIGDCIPGPALAHVASIEGVRAAEAMKYGASHEADAKYEPVNYDLIPSCTYCHPEVASVGLTEKGALEKGLEVKIGRFPFTASGRAKAMGETTGFIKIIADQRFGQIVGAHIIGPGATELISEITLGASMELLPENFARTVHAHPTLAEGVMEAAADVLGEAINI
ncbi:MAG: dihydrolipoyl dehydrogenase [Leptospirales bacterium]|jgi:dihydrolipoamide dehydrogenase